MDLATTLSVVQTIRTAIQTLDSFKAMLSISNFERELADLRNTVNYVKSVLEDAAGKQDALNHQETSYIEELKGGVYDADNVLNEVVNLVKKKQAIEASHEVSDKTLMVIVTVREWSAKQRKRLPEFRRLIYYLQNTIDVVKTVLEDAEGKQGALNEQERFYIEQLKDAMYDADDVLDEFVTLVKQKQAIEAGDKVSNKVMRSLLYRFKGLTHNLSRKVKNVNKKLDAIALKNNKYCCTIKTTPIKFIKPETSSFVYENDPITGRNEDLEKIVEMLLGPSDNILSLAIVGMGGLGKTALAKLVYNDPRITSAFPLRSWTCIADYDHWNLEHYLGKIAGMAHADLYMQLKIMEELEGKKYLIVLDDVWTENCHKWLELENILMVGEIGSRIIVTTRSKRTAQIIRGVRVHELQGLSENESWRLFERMAFRTEQRENHEEFVKLGKDIVKKCFNVPLAIRVVGSLLGVESKPKWESFLADINKIDGIISKCDDIATMYKILSLSYYQLNSSLKSCFAYCAIFPKDFKIEKQMLIRLWMAQGYINAENVGEDYFHILLQKCFFQDVRKDKMGEIVKFKMHDLLHDIAEQMSGNEILRLNSRHLNVDKKVRHLSLLDGFCVEKTFNKAHTRTWHQVYTYNLLIESGPRRSSDHLLSLDSLANPFRSFDLSCSIANWSSLRSLDLRYSRAVSLPESIGELFHLRYLNLSSSEDLKVLPDSITKLVNLQNLDLSACRNLEELPKDVWKLVNLSTLNLTYCNELSHMPSKMTLLTKLHTLGLFVVGGASSYQQQCFDGLEELSTLKNLKGALEIRIVGDKNAKYVKEEHVGGAYLMSKVHLDTICIQFTNGDDEIIEWEEALLEEMQPHPNIRELRLCMYNGEKMPRWPSTDNSTSFFFPHLVKLTIEYCRQLRSLPSLEKLPHLKEFRLEALPKLEYVVNNNLEVSSLGEGTSFFPCLEEVYIYKLPKLKGWWPVSGEQNEQRLGEPFHCFAQLKKLEIYKCPMLKSIPICSRLNTVHVRYDSDSSMEIDDMDKLPPNYKCLLPSQSESRMILLNYFETFLPNEAVE